MNVITRESRLISATDVLRSCVYGVAATVFWWTLSVGVAIFVAAVCAASASLSADRLVHSRARTGAVLGVALVIAVAGVALAYWVLRVEFVSAWLGPVVAVSIAEVMRAACLTTSAAFALRFCAARHALVPVLEVGVVAAAFVGAVAAHREGMINRPLPLGDFAWSHGIDPTLILLGIGMVSAVLLAALLLQEERRGRIVLHLGALAALVLLLIASVQLTGLPTPSLPEDLGLTGTSDDEGEPQSRQARGVRNEFDFKSEYNAERGQMPVAVVVLHDEYAPASGIYYFRQSALSRYNGRRLVRPTRDDVDLDIIASFPAAAHSLAWLPPDAAGRRPVRTTTGMLIDHTRPFTIDAPQSLAPVGREDPRFRRVYQSVSLVLEKDLDSLFGGAGGDPNWGVDQFDYYTRAPDDPRYGAVAQQLLETLKPDYRGDPFARALAIKRYLDANGIYSRKNQHADARDPAASFLFGDLTGYCVHFAHAAVYLMRALGVPSRVATGYAVPAAGRGDGSSIMIRGLNGHAWPEIYLDGVGWIVVDLAPETVLDEFLDETDGTLQMMLGQMLRDGARAPESRQRPSPFDLAALLRALGALVALILLGGFLIKAYRRLLPRFAPERELGRVAYRAALDRLAVVGLKRRYGEGRERFADRAGEFAPSIDTLTRTHLGASLGGHRVQDRAALLLRLEALAQELRRSTPRWRRCAGALNPYSWLGVR